VTSSNGWAEEISQEDQGTLYLQQVAIPGYVPFTGHWGFTASTGGAAETHWIQGITMHFPDGQGCVP
jgi:hypothetical protein